MNTKKIIAATAAILISVTSAMALDQYFIVTITDMVGDKEFFVKDKDETKELQKRIADEAKLFPKILAAKKKEWDAEPDAHQFKWQGNKLKPRQIKVSSAYTDREKADAKADKMTDKELGIDDKAPKKKEKKLSEAEQEKAYQEAQKLTELKNLAEDILKEMDSQIKGAGK